MKSFQGNHLDEARRRLVALDANGGSKEMEEKGKKFFYSERKLR